MHSKYSRKKIIAQLHGEWLKEAEKIMEGIISANAQNIGEFLKNAQKLVEAGEAGQAFRELTDKIASELPQKDEKEEDIDEKNAAWVYQIKQITATVPEVVNLEQDENCFRALPEDSVFIKTGKFFKRFFRASGKGVNTTVNGIRGVFGGSKKPAPVWKHKVLLKNIIDLNLLDLSPLLLEWDNEMRKLEVEILLEADSWTLHSSGLVKHQPESTEEENQDEDSSKGAAREITHHDINPNQDDLKAFFKEAVDKLNRLETDHAKKLEEALQNISERVESAIAKTGTIDGNKDEFELSNIAVTVSNVILEHQRNRDTWDEISDALVNRVNLSMGFIDFYSQVQERVEGFNDSVEEFFQVNMELPQQKLMELLGEAIAIFDDSKERAPKKVREMSAKHHVKISQHVEDHLMKPVSEFIEEAEFSTKLDRFVSAIPEWAKAMPEKAVLVEELDLTKLPPKYEFTNVDWQVLVQRIIDTHLAKEFMPKEVKPEQFLIEVSQELREISEIIYTNLEVADEVKKSDEEEPLKVARDGLDRAKNKLNDLMIQVGDKRKELTKKLAEKQDEAFKKLAMLLEKQDVNELRLAGVQYKAKETAVGWKTKLQVRWAKIEEKAELLGRFIWRKLKQYGHTLRKFLGFAEKEKLEGDKTDLATFLSETDEQIASLPFIYRRLFDFKKEVDDRFYIRRPEQFDRFKKGYELWQNNFPSTFAIIGEKGSGKNLFSRVLVEEVLTKHEILVVNFEDTIWKPEDVVRKISSVLKLGDINSTEALIAAISRKKKRVIIILENIQNCYLRNISGFDAIEQLVFLISETNKEILWIASSTRYAWVFLDKVMNIADYFTHTVQSDNLSDQQIEELILKRHRASGYQLNFLADEPTKKSRSYRKLMDDVEKTQEFLQNRYFEKLAKLAEGNPSIAMIYWIRSIKDHDESHFNINPFEFGAINRIEELESHELFSLAAFVLHDSLTSEDLSKIMHQPLRESKVMVSRLVSRSILYSSDYGYMLNHLIYRQVVRVLKEANFIH